MERLGTWAGSFVRSSFMRMASFIMTTLIFPGEDTAYSKEDVDFAKLHFCINVVGGQVMGNILRAVWAKERLSDETVTLRDYCKSNCGWTKRDFKDKITNLDEHYLDKCLMTEEYDLSFACKIMQSILTHVSNNLSDGCRDQLAKLQKHRNTMCHYYRLDINLESEIEKLKEVLRNIYIGIGDYLQISFSDNIADMESILTDVYNDVFVIDLNGYKENDQSKMIIDGRLMLEERYSKLCVLNPCSWIDEVEHRNFKEEKVQNFTIEKIFTPLKLEGQYEVELNNLFTVKPYKSITVPPTMILTGLAGCGKSSLCRYLVHEWIKRKDDIKVLSSFDLVFLIELRRVKSEKILEFFYEEIGFNRIGVKQDDIILLLQELNLLFIIDGYDECRKMGRSLVKDLFTKFSDKRILITTRPDFYDDIALLARQFVKFQFLEVCGFDDEHRVEFTEKVFIAVEPNPVKCKSQIKKFLEYINDRGKVLDDHLKLPLTLTLLIYLWKESPTVLSNVTSATTLYVELFNLCRNKLAERLSMRAAEIRKLDRLILSLGQQAWAMLKEARNIIDSNIYCQLQKACKDEGIDVVEFLSAFLMCSFDENQSFEERVYEFLHKTQMEYLAAEFLAEQIKKNKRSILDLRDDITNSNWQYYKEVLRYLTGHLALQKDPDVLGPNFPDLLQLFDDAGISNDNYNYWWNLIVESVYNRDVCHVIASEKLSRSSWFLDAKHVVSGLRLLSDTPVLLETLTIDIASDVEPYDLKYFRVTMKSLKNKLKERHHKKNPILVELHFWRHEVYGHIKGSDEFLRTLYPWGHLTNFTGCLGEQEQGKEVLAYCFKLKNIRAHVSTPKAIACLSSSLGNLKKVRKIRLTLALPLTQDPKELHALKYNGTLELSLMDLNDKKIDWVIDVIKQIVMRSGCSRLHLYRSELSYGGIDRLCRNLCRIGISLEKISVEPVNDLHEAGRKELNVAMERDLRIKLNWF